MNYHEKKFDHSICIGGTGMLFGVSLHLATLSRFVTVIARNAGRLEILKSTSANISPITADYSDIDKLINQLADRIKVFGPISGAVS